MIIGIRREDKNLWEGRVPLIPSDVEILQEKYNFKFIIQPSNIRAFSDNEYEDVGATISEDLSSCEMIIAVKEIPKEFFREGKKYLFFSHVIKGQKYNMPSLQKMIDLKVTLMDYERIVDENGRRLIFFGKYAGIAGMIDSLWAFGERLKNEGKETLFSDFKYALKYSNLEDLKSSYIEIGKQISEKGFPEEITPMIVGVTGYGNVSKGAQEIIDILPTEEIDADDLINFVKSKKYSNKKIYKVVFKEIDMFEPNDKSQVFDLQDYFNNPGNYQSKFDQYIPYLNILVNGIYWDYNCPKLITKDYLQKKYNNNSTLKVIGDVTCDVNGAIECNMESTNSGNPVYVYDVAEDDINYGVLGNGPVVLAVDNLPCEVARESSTFFSNILVKYFNTFSKTDFSKNYENVNIIDDLKRSIILYKGEFPDGYKYLEKYLDNELLIN